MRIGKSALNGTQQYAIQAKHREGWKVEALATEYGVSRRTIYRYLKGTVKLVWVGRWCGDFRVSEDTPPKQIGQWR